MQVAAIQQVFVVKVLESSNFNKVLSGARECCQVLQRAMALDKEAALQQQPALLFEVRMLCTALHTHSA